MNRFAIHHDFIFHSLAIILIGFVILLPQFSIAENHLPKAPSQLKFGARADAAPLSYKDGQKWRGYSIDLCRRIYEKYKEDYVNYRKSNNLDSTEPLKRQLDFVPIKAHERMDSLQKGRIDILCGSTTVTISRMRDINFTLLTFVSGASVMKKKKTDSSRLFKVKGDKGQGAKITYVGCTEGMEFIDCTTTENWITKRFGSTITQIPKQSHTEAFNALMTDEADFYAGDRVILENKLKSSSQPSDFELAPTFLTFEPYAIAITKDNDLLLHSANSTLAKLYRRAGSGGIDEIYYNHFKNEQSKMLKNMYLLQAFPE